MKLHKDGTLEGSPEESESIQIIKLGKNTKFILEFPPEYSSEKRLLFSRDFAKWVNELGNHVMVMPDGVRILMLTPEE